MPNDTLPNASAPNDAPILLPYQQKWVNDPSPVKIAEKSRRIGLTWAEAADVALTAAEARGQDAWYIGYNKDMALEFIETVAAWAKAYSLAAAAIEDAGDVLEDLDREKGVQAFRVRFASGNKVVALSSRPTNLRGKQGIVVLDEFAFHGEQQELLKAAIALLMWGGKVRIISTHNGAENPFNELVDEVRAGRKPYSLHHITFDDALADGLYRRICLRLGREWSPEAETAWRNDIVAQYGEHAEEELFCIPKQGGGVYIPGVLLDACMDDDTPVIRWSRPAEFAMQPAAMRELVTEEWLTEFVLPYLKRCDPTQLSAIGQDFGRSGDLSVLWPTQILPRMVMRAPFIVELRNIPFEQQKQIFFYIADRLPRLIAGALDATGNGAYLAEVAMQRYGAERIHQVKFTPEWYRVNMPKYKAAIEDRLWRMPRDADIKNDHRAIRIVRGVPRIPERQAGSTGQRHGDAAIAGVLCHFAASADPVSYEYTPAPRVRGFDAVPNDDSDERTPMFGGRGSW